MDGSRASFVVFDAKKRFSVLKVFGMGLFRKLFRSRRRPIIVVSGLPRSGTSMMMKMLEAGGVDVLVDNIRKPNEDNPRGYYEFERVKKLREGDVE